MDLRFVVSDIDEVLEKNLVSSMRLATSAEPENSNPPLSLPITENHPRLFPGLKTMHTITSIALESW